MDQHTSITLGASPRQGDFAEQPGNYEPVVRIHAPVLDPGDTVEGDLFISGYGKIETAKLVFYPFTRVFDADSCEFQFGFQSQDGLVTFGGETQKGIGEHGVTISLTGGMQYPGWDRPTLFFDLDRDHFPQSRLKLGRGMPRLSFDFRHAKKHALVSTL